MKLKDFVIFNPRETLSKSKKYRKISMDQIKPFTRKVESNIFLKYSGGSKFQNGDTIFARITPCLENGKTSFVSCLEKNEVAFGSTEFIIVRSKPSVSLPLFVYYLMVSKKIRDKAIISMTGSSGRERVQQIALDNIIIPDYTIDYQQHIVNTIGSIDDLIDNYNKQVNMICLILKQSLLKYNDKITIDSYNPTIIKSGIKPFDLTKNYLDTSSVNNLNNIEGKEVVSYKGRPSRANMQPIANSIWFAKMKGSNKKLLISNLDKDLINNYVLSTGFLGIKESDKLPLSFLTAVIISNEFNIQRDLNSVGTTMAGVNNETFSKILVPKLSPKEVKIFNEENKCFIEQLSYLRKKINALNSIKTLLLNKYF